VRIVAGRWGSHDPAPTDQRVRTPAESVRDRWITLLDQDLQGARVLELYAGTGAVGLEALSRGARSVDFLENAPAALHSLKANIAVLRVRDRARVFQRDALRFAYALPASAYDVALADPPYGSRQSDRLVERWLEVPFAPVLAIEHAATHRLPGSAERHRFEESTLSIYRVAPPPESSADR
jgi:16S rRNA (guanine966-N2)-methyltransferase